MASLFNLPGAASARAKSLIAGDAQDVASSQPAASLGASDVGVPWDLTPQDKAFWAAMAGADRRLDELRRAIDEVAAEAMAPQTGAEASPSPATSLGESRYETAKRKIAEALNAEKR